MLQYVFCKKNVTKQGLREVGQDRGDSFGLQSICFSALLNPLKPLSLLSRPTTNALDAMGLNSGFFKRFRFMRVGVIRHECIITSYNYSDA
jgi:hypothetical protein